MAAEVLDAASLTADQIDAWAELGAGEREYLEELTIGELAVKGDDLNELGIATVSDPVDGCLRYIGPRHKSLHARAALRDRERARGVDVDRDQLSAHGAAYRRMNESLYGGRTLGEAAATAPTRPARAPVRRLWAAVRGGARQHRSVRRRTRRTSSSRGDPPGPSGDPDLEPRRRPPADGGER